MVKEIFHCRQCGYCCQGETTVSLDAEDIERLTDHLRLPFEEIKRKYLRITGSVVQMKVVDGHCIFYNKGCTIHPGKPWRCSQWPLHPSMLADKTNYETITASCPGIKKTLAYEDFCKKLSNIIERSEKDRP